MEFSRPISQSQDFQGENDCEKPPVALFKKIDNNNNNR
jgi:hypothetical protein